MTNHDLDALLQQTKNTRAQRETLETALETCRRTARDCAIRLIFDYGYSLNKVAALTGHQRPTLRTWIQVEAAKRVADGEELPAVAGTVTWSDQFPRK